MTATLSADTARPTVPALTEQQRRMYRGAVWLVIVAESMIFVTLFSTRFLLAGTTNLVVPDSWSGLLISALLVVSLLPAWMGLSAVKRSDFRAMARLFRIAGALGGLALVAIVADWLTLSFSPGSAFGENYVVSTGYHALHIILGGIWLIAAAAAGKRGRYSPDNHWVVEGAVVFWSFVVAMWLALYVIFFLA